MGDIWGDDKESAFSARCERSMGRSMLRPHGVFVPGGEGAA